VDVGCRTGVLRIVDPDAVSSFRVKKAWGATRDECTPGLSMTRNICYYVCVSGLPAATNLSC
jgi:hypothetical protein